MSLELTVAELHPAAPGKRTAAVVAADGQKFEIWPEKLAGFAIGRTYSVDVEDRDYNGRTIRKIVKATPLTNGHTNSNARGVRAPELGPRGHMTDSPTPSTAGEVQFVSHCLAAMIASGKIAHDDKRALFSATMNLRALFEATFGAK
jgi:hypothetical protein